MSSNIAVSVGAAHSIGEGSNLIQKPTESAGAERYVQDGSKP